MILKDSVHKKAFKIEEVNSNTILQIKNDMKNNPHLYMHSSSYSKGINVKELLKLIGVIKKKKTKKTQKPINYKQLDSLFSNSALFNDDLLIQLKIPKDYKYLFFQYCEAYQLDHNLLKTKDNLILLDALYNYSIKFLELNKLDTPTKK